MTDIAIFRINYKSDFILTLNSDAGWLTPFCIKFWTGAPSQAYFVGFDGTTYTHCAPVAGEPTKLLVQFDDHHLPIGDLKFQIGYHFTVEDFPTSVEDEVINQTSVIIEVDGAPAQVMLDFNGDTAPEIEFSLPAYANEAQRIANEEQRIAHEAIRIVNEESRIAAETIRQQNEAQRIAQETARVNEFATLKSQSQAATRDANEAATLANQKAQLAADKAALAGDAATLANQKAQLAADKAALANAAAQLANEKAALAQQKAEYAQQQGGYAKDQGDYAKDQGDYAKAQGDTALADHQRAEADHGIAMDDHTQAGNDHTRAESDHGIAVDDHTQAGNDHTRAESDHGIAVNDHTQAGNDHTRAESDHGIAADDHTQAGNDHTRAESDHTRAESDHAAVEVYVDSLGVFDLSKHNAVGGVLATYADLSAALTALNALDSKYKYGGMSFKFVQSSDNKYVKFFCTADEFTTDVTKWQGVDDVPTANSKNLITSGGVYDALQGEYVVVTAAADTGSVATAMIGIYDVNDVLIVEGEGEVTARLLYGKTYKVKCSRVYDYLTPAPHTFVASQPSRTVTMNYTYIQRNTITIDQTVSNEQSMISGDVQGDVIKAIRAASHLYLGKQTEAGNQLICQLSDTDGTKYHDGTTAAMDGSEGDQWLKLPVFWWKATGIGTPDADDTYDQYSFSFAFAGEPDPTWHKWEGDTNLLGAKKMYVADGKGYSRSGIQGSANFTQAQGNSYAAARGTGYATVTWEWQWMMCVLFYAWYGRMNSQAQCGSGSNSNTRTLGTKDSLGMTDTTSSNGNADNTKFWGIENWWGDITEWIGNITSQDYLVTIVDMNTKQSRTVSGWYQFGGNGGYASRFKVTDLLDFIPRAKNGTDTTYYCDWVNGNTGSRVVYRSSYHAHAYGGVAFVCSVSAPSFAYAYIGSRLAFNGVITEADSVAAYKAALA